MSAVKNNLPFEAVIFDMDGVIINSEPLWSKAENIMFSKLGVNLTDDLRNLTKSMTTTEATKFWYEKYPWENLNLEDVENEVINYVCILIEEEALEIKGVKKLLQDIKDKGLKIGLATNSPHKVIQTVLSKLDIAHFFDVISSANDEPKGKPDPSVYLTTAKKLNVNPVACLVFEDSYSGVLSAKNANMTVVGFADEANKENLENADFTIESFASFDLSAVIVKKDVN